MIELRWVVRHLPKSVYWGSTGVHETEKVLQYRFLEPSFEKDKCGLCWTDWQDVPTVTE